MTVSAVVSVDRRRRLGSIDPRIYGQFVEHVGRVVYGGVFEPGSPFSDEAGYRLDVLDSARRLAPSVLRWPGGNFASGYHWRDGVGPANERPTRHDLAWDAIDTNAFGTEEFLEFARRLGAAPYLNLNASTGSIDEAQAWVEYCNSTNPLPEVALRRNGPHPEPHGVGIWGIGNENYGWWQHGHSSADRYGEMAREWGKLLHWTSPGIKLVGVGAPDPSWNWTVLSTAGRSIDYLSLHFYWHGQGADRYHAMLAGPIASERVIEGTWGLALEAARKLGVRRPIRLCVDEWGVWATTYGPLGDAVADLDGVMRHGLSARSGIDTRFEEAYDLKDALTVATWFHVMWRHPEKIAIATLAQMVNAIAPIMADDQGVVLQTIFHPIAVARAFAQPVALDVLVETATLVPAPGHPDGELPAVDVAATCDPSSGRIHVSVVNRHLSEEAVVELPGVAGSAQRIELHHDDVGATNTADAPDRVAPVKSSFELNGRLVVRPHSHTTVVLE
jgi:alpha-N-arabinofuranosidase